MKSRNRPNFRENKQNMHANKLERKVFAKAWTVCSLQSLMMIRAIQVLLKVIKRVSFRENKLVASIEEIQANYLSLKILKIMRLSPLNLKVLRSKLKQPGEKTKTRLKLSIKMTTIATQGLKSLLPLQRANSTKLPIFK